MVAHRCLAFLQGLSRFLQERALDVGRAMGMVSVVQTSLQDARDGIEAFHNGCFTEAEKAAEELDIPVCRPRICGRQTKRNNVPAESPEDYYRRALTIPFLDHLLSEMASRFSALQDRASEGMRLVPSVFANSATMPSPDDLCFYEEDLPSQRSLSAELEQWRIEWANKPTKETPSTIAAALGACDGTLYPNIKTILKLCATYPVTSAECERRISSLRLIKTFLRSTMSQDRLSSLAMIYSHRNIPISSEQVVRDFARKKPKRMMAVSFLSD